MVKSTTKPVGVVIHRDRLDAANPRHVSFLAFLPEQHFANFLELIKLCRGVSSMRYWIRFDFIGFIQHGVAKAPEVIGYDEWLGGRPCLSEGIAFEVSADN